MLSAIGLTSPTLKVLPSRAFSPIPKTNRISAPRYSQISLVEETLFLHPTPVDKPSMDPVVHGIVTLNLPKSRTVKYLTVKLVGKQDIGWPSSRPYESTTTIEREVSLFRDEDEETVLEKGEHTFVSRCFSDKGLLLLRRSKLYRLSQLSCRAGRRRMSDVNLVEFDISSVRSQSLRCHEDDHSLMAH